MSQTTPSGVIGFIQQLTSEQLWKSEAVIYGNNIYRDGKMIYQGRPTMRFTTIWTLPGLPLRERIDRTLDCWALNIVDWLPKRLAFWVAYRLIGHATMKSVHVPATPLDVVLKNIQNWRDGKPIEEWKPDHKTWYYSEDDHSEHVHAAPSSLAPVKAIDLDNGKDEA